MAVKRLHNLSDEQIKSNCSTTEVSTLLRLQSSANISNRATVRTFGNRVGAKAIWSSVNLLLFTTRS